MGLVLSISPAGQAVLDCDETSSDLGSAEQRRIEAAFSQGTAAGLFELVGGSLQAKLPAGLAFARDVGRSYLTLLCHTPGIAEGGALPPLLPPDESELAFQILQAPPLKGLEYLQPATLADWWQQLDRLVREQSQQFSGGVQAYLRQMNPLWRLVGRVTFHLAENKRDGERPFAFLATYTSGLSPQGRPQHLPLSRALQEYAGSGQRQKLLSLLLPVQRASEASTLAKELVDSGDLYRAMAWTPHQAYRFLQEVIVLEEAGLIVRVPDWWKSRRPPRPVVSVSVGGERLAGVGVEAMLDFDVNVTLEGEQLTEEELAALLNASGGLVALRGQWVEVDREQLTQALEHWRKVQARAGSDGLTFLEGMRLLAGMPTDGAAAGSPADSEQVRQWTGIMPGPWLEQVLAKLRNPAGLSLDLTRAGLIAELRPYQITGVKWLRFMAELGLGACLADDMGLGKTVQVLALLLLLREAGGDGLPRPSLLVVPASLIANWKAETRRFAPSLSIHIAHPSETDGALDLASPAPGSVPGSGPGAADKLAGYHLVVTTYSMLLRLPWLTQRSWRLVILDEGQAIKNPGTRQAQIAKTIQAHARIVLTGTPIENRLTDLWSLFDFLNPGLLGGAKAFTRYAKELSQKSGGDYAPLRALIQPYILRRLKTDKTVIRDLPEKTEVNAYCPLTRRQAALYEQTVRELDQRIREVDGIQRRGLVLATLMRLKQICNHPSQWLNDSQYAPADSGKFARLQEICDELAQRQERALVFTQFRELTAPLAAFLERIFGRSGLVLHGGTPVGQRRKLVETFQQDNGPPFFVLSLKAGGTGLNLTAASQVIHFDRWWNPAVENQATDRAFRIGQKHNVLVHKFVCRGTIEDRIDQLIQSKVGLSRELLEDGAESVLTEMAPDELIRFVALDLRQAIEV